MWAVKKRLNRSRCRLGGACSTRTLFQILSMYSRLELSILVHSTATQPENLIWKAEAHGHPSPSLSFLSPFLFPLSFPLPSFLLYPLSSPSLRSRSLKSSYGGLALCWPSAQVHETITILLVTLSNIHRFKTKFTYRLSNKPFLIWLLTTPPHLKYISTLPCNLSLMAC